MYSGFSKIRLWRKRASQSARLPHEREDLERLARYIIRNPFAVEKMQVGTPNRTNAVGSII